MSSLLEIGEIILQTIRVFKDEFTTMPYEYLYEEDIRARFYNILKDKINFKIKLPKVLYGTEEWDKGEIEVSPVKCEYSQVTKDYFNKFGASKFDIVILRQDNSQDNFYMWPCSAIIEIKYSTNKLGDNVAGHKIDIEKVMNYTEKESIKLAIHFDLYKFDTNQINKWYKDKNIEYKELNDDLNKLGSDKVYAFYISPFNKILYAGVNFE